MVKTGVVIRDRQLAHWQARGILHGFSPPENPPTAQPLPVRARQVHGRQYLEVSATTPSPAGEADALISMSPGIAVGIATADCVPILLTTAGAETVAAIHAGWRGTLADIVGTVVSALELRGVAPAQLEAAIGPAIGRCCFEVEDDFRTRFVDAFGDEVASCWEDGREGHGTLDLPQLNQILLARAGIPQGAIHLTGHCTFCAGDGYASYRRQGKDAGRQISWIRVAT